jgi:hypothetical protein
MMSQCQATSDHINRFSSFLGDPTNVCGPILLGGGGDQDSEEYLSLTEENDISWSGLYDQQTQLEGLEFLVGLGTNPDLLETIETEQDDQVIMAEISNATPFLSDNLLEAILETEVLSDSQKIISLKPHVPLMPDILSMAQNRLSPQHYLQLESYNSLKMFSSRDSLLALRDEAYGDLQIIFYELLNAFWSNGDFQNVDLLLNEHDIPLSDKLKISSALVQEKYALAQTLLDNFPEQTVEDTQFKAIQGVNLKRLQNDGLYTPSTAELQFLNDYASSNTSAAVYARALLRHFNGTLFVHRDYNESQALNGGVGNPNDQEIVPISRSLTEDDIDFKIVPNPSTGDFEVQSLNGKMIRRLDLIDINGSVIFSMTGEQNVMEIRLANKPVNGIYYVVSEFTDGSRSFRSVVLND